MYRNNKILKYGAPAALSGVLLTACQPLPWNVNLGFLAWIALVPFAVAIKEADKRDRFWIGSIAGAAHFATVLYWLIATLHVYGNLSLIGSTFVSLLLVALETAYFILLAIYIGKIIDAAPSLPFTLILPLAWVLMEFACAVTPFGGFPWSLLGYSQGYYPALAQSADIGGVYIVSFLIALVNGAIADIIMWKTTDNKSRFPTGSAAAASIFLLLNVAYGLWRIGEVERRNANAPSIMAASLQGDIRQDEKWTDDSEEKILNNYIELQREAMYKGAKLIVWPEAATPFAFERDFSGILLTEKLSQTDTYTLLGSADYYIDSGIRKFSNSAYLIGPKGVEGKYSKMHLVPFGEYIPLIKLLGFVDKIVKGAAGNFTAGSELEVFQLPQGRLSVIICYEAIFGSEVRRFRKAGAELLLNITNDAWFGDTSAPRQHLSMAAFRCIENHVWMIRAANTGISAIIDPLGRVRQSMPVFTRGSLVDEVKFIPGATIYAKIGDVFLYLCIFSNIALFAWTWKMKVRRNSNVA